MVQIPDFQVILCKLRHVWLHWNMDKSLNFFERLEFWRRKEVPQEVRGVRKAPSAPAFFFDEQNMNEVSKHWHKDMFIAMKRVFK